jgi:Na+-transporting NADH:ubiquinone oxidoreductase subunit C
MVVIPVEGKGLWSTLYGFLALDKDVNTIKGLTFYQHAETPGLGGEVDNPKWKALWPGRKAFGDDGQPKIAVIKGQAGPVAEDPYQVDGLSGATITARGVSHLVQFWLGTNGFGPYLKQFKERGS